MDCSATRSWSDTARRRERALQTRVRVGPPGTGRRPCADPGTGAARGQKRGARARAPKPPPKLLLLVYGLGLRGAHW